MAIGLLGASLTACVADPDKGMPYGYMTVGDAPLTAEKVTYQDTVAQPRCEKYSKETVPSAGRGALAYGVNHGVGGFVAGAAGGAASTALEYGVLGAVLAPHALLAVGGATGINAGIQSGVQAAISGAESSNVRRHATTQACLSNEALGNHMIPPSVGRGIQSSRVPQSFGAHQDQPPAQLVAPDQ